MKSEVACVVAAFAIVVASVSGCGDDDFEPYQVPNDTDASVAPVLDASAADADAQSDASQGPLEQCQACLVGDCGAALLTCVQDPVCRDLATCAATSGCLSDLQTCVPLCLADSELSTGELLNALAQLQTLATSCTSCFATCQSALPGGFGGDAGFGGFGGGGR